MTQHSKAASVTKLHSFISTVVFGLTVLAQAQNVPGGATIGPDIGTGTILNNALPAAAVEKPVLGGDVNSGVRIETLLLKAGPLHEVVDQVERHFMVEDPKKPDVLMPNILYGKDAYNSEMPGDLRVRGVSALQAVALAAAAAGCTLQPIFAPKETANVSALKAIGYRIVRESAFTPLRSSAGTIEQPLSDLDRQINSVGETLGQNHPSVVSAREPLERRMIEKRAGGLVGIGLALAKKDGLFVVEKVLLAHELRPRKTPRVAR